MCRGRAVVGCKVTLDSVLGTTREQTCECMSTGIVALVDASYASDNRHSSAQHAKTATSCTQYDSYHVYTPLVSLQWL